MTLDEVTCLALLGAAIARLQSCEHLSTDARYAAIRPYVTDRFDPLDVCILVPAIKAIEQITVQKDTLLIDFVDAQGDCQRAQFSKQSPQGCWGMESLKFECPICFGDGMNDGKTCLGCSGNGWGA